MSHIRDPQLEQLNSFNACMSIAGYPHEWSYDWCSSPYTEIPEAWIAFQSCMVHHHDSYELQIDPPECQKTSKDNTPMIIGIILLLLIK